MPAVRVIPLRLMYDGESILAFVFCLGSAPETTRLLGSQADKL
jgi:hypothetical protein